MPEKEGIDTFRRLSKLLVEKLDLKSMPVAPSTAEEPPAKSARRSYGLSTRVPVSTTDDFAVRPEALAGFLGDLIRTELDDIVMQFGFKILGQIRGVTRERLECIWLPFLKLVPDVLEAHSVPLSTHRYQCIFGGILDAYINRFVGKQPQIVEGSLQRPPVLCHNKTCQDCVILNNFLADPSQRQIYLSIHSNHLESQFRKVLGCTWSHVDGRPAEVRLITKVPPPDPRRVNWDQCCHHAQEEIKKIDQEKLLAVLGEAHFKRITTMSHLRRAPPVPAWVPVIPSIRALVPVSGNQGVQQPGNIPGMNMPGWGATAQQNTAPARPSQPAAPVAGVKRPAQPNAQVIDLTWMD